MSGQQTKAILLLKHHTIRNERYLPPFASVIALILGLTAPQTAYAQQPDQPQAAPQGGLEEITVTAQKREEKLQNVPISIGVLTAQALQAQNIQNVDDFAGKIPNVQTILPFGPQEPQFSFRGVTETDFQPNQSAPIAMYVDGVFKSVGALQALQLYDIERVEVLKGPQGTLQGRNATGGAINIYTVQPKMDFSGYVTAGVGNYGRYETEGALNIPIVDGKLAIRGAWTFTNVDGYFHNELTDSKFGSDLTGVYDYAGRISALFTPTDDFEAIVRISSARSDPVNYGEYSNDICCGGLGIPPGALAPYGVTGGYGPTGETRAGLSYDDNRETDVHGREIKSRNVTLEINYNVTDELKLTSVTGYDMGQWFTDENDAGAFNNVDEAKYFSRVHSFQEELRVTSSFDGPFNFIAGALYGQESLFLKEQTSWAVYQPAVLPGSDTTSGQPINICLATGFYACTLYNQFNQKRVDYAGYVNSTYKIMDDLQATVGTRYTDDWVGVQGYRADEGWLGDAYGPGGIINTVPGNGQPAAPDQKLSDHKWLGKAGIDYHIADENMIYASWSLGFRGSAFNAAAQTPAALNGVKPETLIDYEVGSKNQFFDRRLEVNLAGFYYIYRNQQFATLNSQTGLSEEVNLPKINSEGVELDVNARPIDDVTVSLGAGYLYAIYQSGSISNPQSGFNTPDQPFASNVTGERVYTSPHWSWSTSVDWVFLKTDLGNADLYIDGNGITKEYFNAADSPGSQENGYSVWDAKLTFTTQDGNKSISLWSENLLDRKYYTVIFDTRSLVNYNFTERGTPRTFGAKATYKWGGPSTPEEAPAAYVPPPVTPPAPAIARSYMVFFDFNKSDLTAEAVSVVDQAAKNAGPAKTITLTVTGHTDTVGSDAYNIRLSQRRAESVAGELEKGGIPSSEIAIVAKGKRDLLVPTKDGVREPQNRRVTIVYDGGSTS
jgi:iron complex outermembrane receptor protein